MKDCYYSFPDIDTEFFKLASGPNPDTPDSATKQDIFYSKSFYTLLAGDDDGAKIIGGHTFESRAESHENLCLGIEISLSVNGSIRPENSFWTTEAQAFIS